MPTTRVTPAAEACLGAHTSRYALPGDITIAIRWTAIHDAQKTYGKSCAKRHMLRAIADHAVLIEGFYVGWREQPYTFEEKIAFVEALPSGIPGVTLAEREAQARRVAARGEQLA